MTSSIGNTHHLIVVFFILFTIIMVNEFGYVNPVRMKAPWPYGIIYRCNQGNFGPYSHNTPFDFYAWDFDLPMGSLVVAVADGIVSFAGYTGTDGYGNQVRIKNPNGTYSLYAHLSDHCITLGQSVKQGQIIGYSGRTGNATGPHLHFSIVNKIGIGLPSEFSDIGIPIEGGYYTSQNWCQGK